MNNTISRENAHEYFESKKYNYAAEMLNGQGITAQACYPDCNYYFTLRIEDDLAILEIAPGIHCEPEYRGQTAEYINSVNAFFKCNNLRISNEGTVYIQSEHRLTDGPITADILELMERTSLQILRPYKSVIAKLSQGRLITEEEANIEKTLFNNIDFEVFNKERKRKSHRTNTDSSDGIPSFSEYLRKKAEEGDEKARRILEDELLPKGLDDFLYDIVTNEEDDDENYTDID